MNPLNAWKVKFEMAYCVDIRYCTSIVRQVLSDNIYSQNLSIHEFPKKPLQDFKYSFEKSDPIYKMFRHCVQWTAQRDFRTFVENSYFGFWISWIFRILDSEFSGLFKAPSILVVADPKPNLKKDLLACLQQIKKSDQLQKLFGQCVRRSRRADHCSL